MYMKYPLKYRAISVTMQAKETEPCGSQRGRAACEDRSELPRVPQGQTSEDVSIQSHMTSIFSASIYMIYGLYRVSAIMMSRLSAFTSNISIEAT